MLLLISTLTLIALSALCSGSEAAIFSVSEMKARQMVNAGKRSADSLLNVIQNQETHISTIVLLNNIVNIMGSIFIGNLAADTFGSAWVGIFSAVLTFLIIMFAEIIPKALATRMSVPIALAAARPLIVLSTIFKPVVMLINASTNRVLQLLIKPQVKEAVTDESEISYLAEAGAQENAISRHENEYIQNVFKLDDKTAKEIYTPSTVMTTVNADMTLNEAKEIIMSSEHSRIPVMGKTSDEVIGLILLVDLLKAAIELDGETKINDLESIKEVASLPETFKAHKLLTYFQRKAQHLVMIRNDHASLTGLVTLEDVLEIIVGEIKDERDTVECMQGLAQQRGRELKSK